MCKSSFSACLYFCFVIIFNLKLIFQKPPDTKKLIFLFALAAINTTAGGQGTQGSGSQSNVNSQQNPQSTHTGISDVVYQSFIMANPDINKVDWSKMDDNSYRATWDGSRKGISAYYDKFGRLTASGYQITVDELPITVRKYIDEKHQGQSIKNASKVTGTSGNVWYAVRVDETEMKFDSKGAPIMK